MTEGCVGCGAVVEKVDGPIHRYMTSAPGQSVALHLLNLYTYIELQRHITIPRLLGQKGAFHWLQPPSFTALEKER